MVLATVGDNVLCSAGKGSRNAAIQGRFGSVVEQWVESVGAELAEGEARYVVVVGKEYRLRVYY